MPPPPLDHVFALVTPSDMLMKLWWEINQLRESLAVKPDETEYRHVPAYHAFNCAVTSWHMADWIWQSAGEDRTYLLSKLAISATGKWRNDFDLFTGELTGCYRVFHICRQIANGSKHRIIERRPDTNVRAEEHWDWHGVGDPPYSIHLLIHDDGKSRPALDVFIEAAQTWDRLLRDWGFMEPRFVDADAE